VSSLGGVSKHILFFHAVLDCDSTSFVFGVGKSMNLKLLVKYPDLINIAETFQDTIASKEDISVVGEAFFLRVYKAPENVKSINHLRFLKYKGWQRVLQCFRHKVFPQILTPCNITVGGFIVRFFVDGT
jgi:hypothetical protein